MNLQNVPKEKRNPLFWQWIGSFGATLLILFTTSLWSAQMNGGHIFLCLLLATSTGYLGYQLYLAWDNANTTQESYSELEDVLNQEIARLQTQVAKLEESLKEKSGESPTGFLDSVKSMFSSEPPKEEPTKNNDSTETPQDRD